MSKSYCEFMDEITTDELYEGLLAYGFFAEKLPPVFTAIPFFDYCKTLPVPFSFARDEFISFRTMRNISIPRQMGIDMHGTSTTMIAMWTVMNARNAS